MVPSNIPPPIPPENLLNHLGRHDLRSAIVNNLGRPELAAKLGGAEIVPGQWKRALVDSAILRQVVVMHGDRLGLSPDCPPMSPQRKKLLQEEAARQDHVDNDNEQYVPSAGNAQHATTKQPRRPNKYWTIQHILQHLYVPHSVP